MKCQNCGNYEVNFHYSSNINGCVTETHLCSKCASQAGYDYGRMFNSGIFLGGFMPAFGFSAFDAQPQMGILLQKAPVAPVQEEPDIDDDMKARRELNMLREQMQAAAEAEDFEKAVELRDKIKQIEEGTNEI